MAPKHIYSINHVGTTMQFANFSEYTQFIKSIVVIVVLKDKSRVFRFRHNASVLNVQTTEATHQIFMSTSAPRYCHGVFATRIL